MIKFTYQQKIAILRIMLDIINADGRIHEREVFLFDHMKKELDLSNEDIKVIEDKNSLLALAQIREMTDEQKKYLGEHMSKMIIVDGDINVNEVDIYNIVKDFCGIKETFEEQVPDTKSFTKS